ncbi:stage II sporulation protein P [Ammoniphilus sp. CFH 90114]|uniref:stage II sporulation protein P n=1 Tax=Ammoniphilus sp. CFH 90114 TaxID=2493665 RepID=UPI00100FF505|nr:stage II sporulation protein P [Ammoniphilus sp. CFH 90114]RXT08124.1 stage II sporulation protein P [Ammoniphilus sp. CFH 90114]
MNRIYKMRLPSLFLLLSLFSTFLFLSFAWLFSHTTIKISSPSMRQAMSQLSYETIIHAFEMEIPYLRYHKTTLEQQPKPLSLFLFETMTSLKPTDLRSLLGRELPGLSMFHVEVLATGQNVNLQNFVIESPPPTDALLPAETAESLPDEKASEEKATTEQIRSMIFIYNTHNTESWTHVSNNPSVTDEQKNITLVSKRLAEELERRGIRTHFDQTDHQQKLKDQGLPYAFSYAASLKTVQEAIKQHDNIGYIFDIHRDSQPKEQTTAVVNGKSYARPYFVIGKRNKNWEQNAELAKKIHYGLEKKYPGLSIGVLGKAEGNGEYNQSVSPQSILLEIGGIDNTLEETYNTAAALADVIADIYFEKDKKVDSPAPSDRNPM